MQPRVPIIHPKELIGKTIGITQEDGQTTQLCIIEAINEHLNDTESYSISIKFSVVSMMVLMKIS